jgi:hypothetical protein
MERMPNGRYTQKFLEEGGQFKLLTKAILLSKYDIK